MVTVAASGDTTTATAVGRVTLANWDNEIVLDTLVQVPSVPVTNNYQGGRTTR